MFIKNYGNLNWKQSKSDSNNLIIFAISNKSKYLYICPYLIKTKDSANFEYNKSQNSQEQNEYNQIKHELNAYVPPSHRVCLRFGLFDAILNILILQYDIHLTISTCLFIFSLWSPSSFIILFDVYWVSFAVRFICFIRSNWSSSCSFISKTLYFDILIKIYKSYLSNIYTK